MNSDPAVPTSSDLLEVEKRISSEGAVGGDNLPESLRIAKGSKSSKRKAVPATDPSVIIGRAKAFLDKVKDQGEDQAFEPIEVDSEDNDDEGDSDRESVDKGEKNQVELNLLLVPEIINKDNQLNKLQQLLLDSNESGTDTDSDEEEEDDDSESDIADVISASGSEEEEEENEVTDEELDSESDSESDQ